MASLEFEIMEQQFKEYLESATVHGLVYIANTRRLVRLFWVCVVMICFASAFTLIYESFQSWAESPVSTTVNTLPITKLTYPKVTVCPPKNTFTNLNYDLMMLENMTLDNDTRKEMVNYVTELLHGSLHNSMVDKVNKLQDDDRYYNWYHGLAGIRIPYPPTTFGMSRELLYQYTTSAKAGSISTKYFGEKFDAVKVDPDIQFQITMNPPPNVVNNDTLDNITIQIEIHKASLKDLSTGKDNFHFNPWNYGVVDEDVTHIDDSFAPNQPVSACIVTTDRLTSMESIRNVNMDLMPGMNITWLWDWDIDYYDGYDYYDYQNNYFGNNYDSTNENSMLSNRKMFVRNG